MAEFQFTAKGYELVKMQLPTFNWHYISVLSLFRVVVVLSDGSLHGTETTH
jgi:hypothetical protein